jgi:ABC-type sugar transport system ATPase subunit
LADRLLVMAAGQIVADLPSMGATEERILDLAMGENLTRDGKTKDG